MITHDEYETANRRGEEMLKGPTVIAAHYDRRIGRIVLSLSTGYEIAFPPRLVQETAGATSADLDTIEITPSGLAVHFPKIDADIYLPSLLQGITGTKAWMAAQMGQVGGSSKSAAKAAASRVNGALGGRPRKQAASV